MAEGRKCLRLALEAQAYVRLIDDVRRKDFDRDGAVEARVVRAIHLAHAARTKQRLDFVRTEPDAR